MSARARKKRSAHRFLLTGATCCALGKYFPITTFRRLIAHTQLTFILFHSGLAFALLRSGVRPHRGAVDRIDGGVDGDYTLDVVALEGGFSDGVHVLERAGFEGEGWHQEQAQNIRLSR